MPQDRLTINKNYLENEIRKHVRAPIKAISLKKLPGTTGYELQPTITDGDGEKTLYLRLPFADHNLIHCNKSDLDAIAQAIMIDLEQIIFS
jgi:hypothetical protein